MEVSTLLADPTAIQLEKTVPQDSSLILVMRATRPQAECPRCHGPSARVHSYYTRAVADWLKRHPGVEVVSRDRSPAYAAGINEGAPGAVQVADRFHLLMNVREAVEKVVKRQNRFLRTQTLLAPPSSAPAPENDAYAGYRLRLQPHLNGVKRAGRARSGPRRQLPSARQAAWMLLRPEKLEDEEKRVVELLRRLSPEVGRAQGSALSFVELVTERRADELRQWLIDALRSEIPEFVSFANGLTSDLQAVQAALEYGWSNGQTEGHVHRLKLIKGQMYGRAKLVRIPLESDHPFRQGDHRFRKVTHPSG